MDQYLEFEDRDLVLDFYFALRDFLYIQERLDDSYEIYTELLPSGEFILRLLCVNPARNLKQCMEQAVSTIFFSATLLPVQYYKELLSGDQEEYAVYADSPFPRENKLLLVASDVSSRSVFEGSGRNLKGAPWGRQGLGNRAFSPVLQNERGGKGRVSKCFLRKGKE